MRFLGFLLSIRPVAARCTAIVADAAAANGSAFAGMNADCQNCDGRVVFIPGRKNNKQREIYGFSGSPPRFVGYGRTAFYEPTKGQKPTVLLGKIPETTERSFAYYEAVLPLMNEKGLGLGESSCASVLMNYAIGQSPKDGKSHTEGLLDITTLMQIALERCETARCGAETIGKLSEEYGFYPMKEEWSIEHDDLNNREVYGDGGEAVTLADKHQDAWVVHLVGGVEGVTKSVWAAQRVPKGHVGFIANNFILRDIPNKQSEDFLFSPKIREAAVKAGLWDGQGSLDFSRVFAPNTVTVGQSGKPPIPMYTSLRQWGLLRLVQPSKKWEMELDPLVYPSFVVPEKQLSRSDVQRWLSDVYEGTEFDMTQGILSGPFGNPYLVEGGPAMDFGQIPRGISIARTVYSIVNESPVKGLATAWYAADAPLTSVYVPFFPQAPACSPYYSQGVNSKFTRESAWWAFDFVANWANINFRNASKENIYPLKEKLESQIEREHGLLHEKDLEAAARWAVDTQTHVVDQWWELADTLIVKYNDGFHNDFVNHGQAGMGKNAGYPTWWAKMVGFNNDVHPIFVKRNDDAPAYFADYPDLAPPNFVANVNPLPTVWENDDWVYRASSDSVTTGDISYAYAGIFSAACALFGAAFGSFMTRRRVDYDLGYKTMD
eukprot:GEMP01000079.1.p2 GENE.GEMP01000079.1~~GEMP01000079.1.p2  ORF type:complete len:662 (+),score=137.81 GEMP01000079.1:7830-9815(+)